MKTAIMVLVFASFFVKTGNVQATVLTYEKACEMLKDAYPDGYYIIKQAKKEEVELWLQAGMFDTEGIITLNAAVHETLHGYDMHLGDWSNHGFFIKQGIEIIMDGPGTFPSIEMRDLVPEGLRNGRYDTYVLAKDDDNFNGDKLDSPEEIAKITLSSIADGIYGLLEEFNAYYHGSQCAVNLMHKGYGDAESTSQNDGLESYYEFNTFMAAYLIFAKEKHPNDYNAVIANKNLIVGYTLIEKKFAALVDLAKSNEKIAKRFTFEGEEYYSEKFKEALKPIYNPEITELNYINYLSKK